MGGPTRKEVKEALDREFGPITDPTERRAYRAEQRRLKAKRRRRLAAERRKAKAAKKAKKK